MARVLYVMKESGSNDVDCEGVSDDGLRGSMLDSRQLPREPEETAEVGLVIHFAMGSRVEERSLTGRSRRLGPLVCIESLRIDVFLSSKLGLQ